MAQIAIINPRFEVSYWGLEFALPLFGKRANLPTACLPLLAALTPEPHQVTLIDENVEDIDFDRLQNFDIVGVTGMIVQRFRMREILAELKRRGIFTVVGGPWITVREDYFGDLADVIFVGEAETTWPQFLDDWQSQKHAPRYEQAEATDMSRVPLPRFDLIKSKHYMFGSLQFSRGCPYQCEFCDIIVIFGRRPRLKTAEQVICELEALRRQQLDIVFVVDDNLIGNKKAIKSLLAEIRDWQRREGYPLTFFTEASLDLADDAELMELMVEANFVSVFIGVESPNEESLRETKKFQNVRRGDTMVDKIHRIQRAGLDVWCGMIVGFDHDDQSIFRRQEEFIEAARLSHVMLGLLYAIPKTPLYDRLLKENRLDFEDQSPLGTNVMPALMTREQLRDGYVELLRDLHEPQVYFDRLDRLYLDDNFDFGHARARYWRRHPLAGLRAQTANAARAAVVYRRLMRQVSDDRLRKEYRRRVRNLLRYRRDPAVVFTYVLKCAIHYHHYSMSRRMARQEMPLVSTM